MGVGRPGILVVRGHTNNIHTQKYKTIEIIMQLFLDENYKSLNIPFKRSCQKALAARFYIDSIYNFV